MDRFRDFASMLGIKHAIVLAPMAGGISTPALVAAVSNAGGLGSFGAGYMTADEIAASISAIRSLTDKPIALNLFAGGYDGTGGVDPSAMMDELGRYHERLGLPAPTVPANSLPPFEEQLEVVLRSDIPIFSFTFGIPDAQAMARMKQRAVKLIGTATSVAEARALEAAGADIIVAQGSDAGSHRGTFLGPLEDSLVGTMALVPQVVDAVSVPVIASGGIMDGRGIAAAAALGASGVQMGTAFLVCPESGAPQAHKNAVLAARDDTTVLTRAFSGRLARGISNSFTASMKARESLFLRFPAQNNLTRTMRSAAARQGDPDYVSLFAGQAASLAREMPAAKLVEKLVQETDAVRAALSA